MLSNGISCHLSFQRVIMELRHLRSFAVLAQELHFSRAARRLNIVQPALSKQIKLLEEEVGCLLLHRNRRGVALSEAGRQFLAEAEQALEHVERAAEAARRAGMGQLGRVRIGYSASAVHSGVLASALVRIETEMPEIEVVLERVEPWQQNERLLADEIDFVFGPRLEDHQGPEFKTRVLAELELAIALSVRHPLASRPVLEREDLKREAFIEFANSEAEGAAVVSHLLDFRPDTVIARPDPIAVLALVQAGRGICVLPSVLRLPDFPQVIYKRLAAPHMLRIVVTSRQRDGDPLLRNLAEILDPRPA
jgi:DNA-binding transcriptional LysR family regulator